MKRNILKYLAVTAALFATFGASSADIDRSEYKGKLKVSTQNIEKVGDELRVSMSVSVDGMVVKPNQTLILTPYLRAQEGTQTSRDLPPVIINGKRQHRIYERGQKLDKEYRNDYSFDYMVKSKKNTSQTINYVTSLPYQSWMSSSLLNLEESLVECFSTRLIAVESLAYFSYQEAPPVEAPKPPIVVKKEYAKEGVAYVEFPWDQYTLLPEFSNNRAELAKIDMTLDSVINDGNMRMTGIYLTGYASPEGEFYYNQRLSQRRADAILTYIVNKYNINRSMCHVSAVGEDWEGLLELVDKSNMEYRSEVLDIIRNNGIFDGREKKLMDLRGGNPYRYMLKEMFPQLRRVTYRITYTLEDEVVIQP